MHRLSDKAKSLRSPWAAYGPAVVVGAVLLVAVVVLFTTGTNNVSDPQKPAPQLTPDPAHDTTLRLAEVRKRTGGDWSKTTAEEKKYLTEISRGHGSELLKMKSK